MPMTWVMFTKPRIHTKKKKTKILTWLDNQCNPTFMKYIRTQQSTNKKTQ